MRVFFRVIPSLYHSSLVFSDGPRYHPVTQTEPVRGNRHLMVT